MKLIVGVLLLSLAAPVLSKSLGDTATLSFGIPITRENGKILPYEEIGKFELLCGDRATVITKEDAQDGVHVVPTVDMLPGYGDYECVMTVVDTDGVSSKPSDSVLVSWEAVAAPTPRAPTELGTDW